MIAALDSIKPDPSSVWRRIGQKEAVALAFDIPSSYAELEAQVQASCVIRAANYYRIHPYVIQAILDVENGKSGTVSKNTNNTYDLGPMQINSSNMPYINKAFPTVTLSDITYKPCVNISVGTWILRQRLDEEPNFWMAVGNYHSKTPKHRNTYLQKVYAAYRRITERARSCANQAPPKKSSQLELSSN